MNNLTQEDFGKSKLKESDIAEILKLRYGKNLKIIEIAKIFNISQK
ncbi:MAG: hypothetical protein QXL01_00305 [Thermoplasmatales archaeon]